MMGLYDMVTGSVGHWTGCWRLMKRKEMMMWLYEVVGDSVGHWTGCWRLMKRRWWWDSTKWSQAL
jgi:hypothetical protein